MLTLDPAVTQPLSRGSSPNTAVEIIVAIRGLVCHAALFVMRYFFPPPRRFEICLASTGKVKICSSIHASLAELFLEPIPRTTTYE